MDVVDLEAVVAALHLDIRCRQLGNHTLKKKYAPKKRGMICKTYKTMSILTLNIHIFIHFYLTSFDDFVKKKKLNAIDHDERKLVRSTMSCSKQRLERY